LLACLFFKVFFGRLFLYLPYQQKRIVLRVNYTAGCCNNQLSCINCIAIS
jgi:hypothetical protein